MAPVLLDMIRADERAFKAGFENVDDYTSLVSVLHSTTDHQKEWAIKQQHSNPSGWSGPFKRLSTIEKFNKIQLEHAATFHKHVMRCIKWIRKIRPDLMEKIEVQTYCALYDLCVQQQTLNSAHNAIEKRIASGWPATQRQLMLIVVEERAKTALSQYRADCLSRRVGILQQQAFSVANAPRPVVRQNVNFSALRNVATCYVCGL